MKIQHLAALVLCSFLSACATNTLNTNFSYVGGSHDGLVVIKAPQTSYETYLNFSGIDIEDQQFIGKGFRFGLQGMYARKLVGNTRASGKPTEFFAQAVTPGDYAFVSKRTYYPNRQLLTCYSLGTVVFRIHPGKINLINLSNVDDRRAVISNATSAVSEQDIQELRDTLKAYPNITGEIFPAEKIGAASFTGKQVAFGSGCPVGKELTFRSRLSAP